MTYSLNTLNADSEGRGPSGLVRFVQDSSLLLAAAGLLFWLIAMLSHNLADPAWSTSGSLGVTHNWGGRFGAWLSDLNFTLFGLSAWWLLLAALRAWLAALAVSLRGAAPKAESAVTWPQRIWRQLGPWSGFLLLMGASCALEWAWLYRFDPVLPAGAGGALGAQLGAWSLRWFGATGSVLLGLPLWLAASSQVFRFSWATLAEGVGERLERGFLRVRQRLAAGADQRIGQQATRQREREEAAYQAQTQAQVQAPTPRAPRARTEPEPDPVPWDDGLDLMPESAPADKPGKLARLAQLVPRMPAQEKSREPLAARLEPGAAQSGFDAVSAEPPRPASRPAQERQPAKPAQEAQHLQAIPSHKPADSSLPQVDLLDPAQRQSSTVSHETLEMTSRLIEKKLGDFGVEVHVIAAQPGPVITRYEIEPATGVKGSQVVNLAKDLARSLSLVSIRVIETIPGKNLMALELPNAKRQTIKLSEILGSSVYQDAKSLLTMGLGKDIAGQSVVADLAKMPHCLVAGTTGSGKSVGINAMILSLLYKADAKDVRLMLIDPKMLELSVYEGIPHLLCPVVTDMKQAANGLNWCVAEMEKRYRLLSKVGVRNLAGYNAKIAEARERDESIPNPFSLTPEAPEPLERLPHIVVVIDELADLMMVVGKKIEELIARLAQKARAAGIHLILATQRPSVDVITGLIKANIPTRISFQVSSKIDSRTILDQMGAEALLGMGDMLYMPSGTGYPTRVHGAFVSDDEVHRVVSYLKEQGGEPDYIDGILEGGSSEGEGGDLAADGEGGGDGEKDPLYDQAVAVVLQDRKASISYVQRKLKIGYNRSARLLEDMEKAGLVSALTTSGQRDILVAARGGD
ncbi:cell division protein FtsK [Malikia spinosa]|uniref:Cell division protein FtsK n=1 Tax=Malikia spinosa TaxID=86180 RepID=A0A2S9KI04_9BURK|nr:DNA translocase FtsK [Malikia spinosa]PRD70078.1 cell division protein FtsK [Malikia spinosa]